MNQQLGFDVWDVLKYQTRRFCGLVTHHIEQFYDVGAAVKGLQNFCLSKNFLSADRFKYFENAGLIIESVNALVDF